MAVAVAVAMEVEVAVIVITYGDVQSRTQIPSGRATADPHLIHSTPLQSAPLHADFEDANGTASRSQTAPNLCNQNQPKWMPRTPRHSIKLPALDLDSDSDSHLMMSAAAAAAAGVAAPGTVSAKSEAAATQNLAKKVIDDPRSLV